MKIDKEQEYLFKSPGAKRWLSRLKKPKPHAILPLTYDDKPSRLPDPRRFALAMDPRMLKMTETLAQRMEDEFPEDVQDNGFAGPSAVAGNFNSILCVSGQPLDPMPLPLMDNSNFIDSMGLRDSIKQQDVPWLKELIRLFFGHATPSSLHIRKAASTGFPFFTNDNQYKKLATHKILTNARDFLQKFNSPGQGRLQALNEYHAIPAIATQTRDQPDSVTKEGLSYKSKVRTAPSEAYARGDVNAPIFDADKTIRTESGVIVPNHFAMRVRTVFGSSGPPNYFGTAVMGCHRAVFMKRFEFTYKVRDDKDKESRISRFKYTVGSDVKNMDTTIHKWFFDFLAEELTNYWDQDLIDFMMNMLRSTYVCPPPGSDFGEDYNPIFGPDPIKGEMTNNVGLASGVFSNPDIGKLWMTFNYLLVYRDAGALAYPSEIEAFLRGQNKDHALLDMSDDACFLTNSKRVRDYLLTAKSPYAVLEVEKTTIYLGSVFAESGGEKRSYPNPITYLVNALAREDSITSYDPVAYAEGVLARYQQYSSTPIFRDMNQIYEEEVRKAFGVNPYLIARSVAKRQKFTDLDALVRANPHYLHYRVDPNDVSKELLDELVSTIPAEDVWPYVAPLLKVPTVDLAEF